MVFVERNSNATNNEEGYLYKIDTSTDQLSYVDALNAAGWVMAHRTWTNGL